MTLAKIVDLFRNLVDSGKPASTPSARFETQLAQDCSSGSVSKDRWATAQQGEGDWWEGVATTGYDGQNPAEFISASQRESMLQALSFLGLPLDSFKSWTVVEFGSGPAGVVEYIEAKRRVAIEPLHPRYRELFPHLAESTVEYLAVPGEEQVMLEDGVADLVICYNMLDHVYDPDKVMEQVARVVRDDGLLLFQVNVYASKESMASKSGLHAELHPFSFTKETALAMLDSYGFEVYNCHFSPGASACNEHYFICACRKRASVVRRVS